MEQAGTDDGGEHIRNNSDGISKQVCYMGEYLLIHSIVWIDIEHIDQSVRTQKYIECGCNQAAGKIKSDAETEPSVRVLCFFAQTTVASKHDQ